MSRWTSINYSENRSSLPKVSCCYCFYIENNLVYIGSSVDLRNRFSGHAFRYGYEKNFITPWGEFSEKTKFKIKYKPSVRYGDWLMIEARLIKKLRPIFNKKLKGRTDKRFI